MKKICSKTAISLIELIIATALIGVVILGLFSINSVLQNNNMDYGQRYLLNSETQATLNHILNNASLAVSDISAGDPGILLIGVPGNPNTLCIHQNIDYNRPPTDNTPNNTPGNYTDDRWLCYTLSNYQINYCSTQYLPNAGNPWGAATCPNGMFLGTAYTWGAPTVPTPSSEIFSITIQNYLDDAAFAAGTSIDPANNPVVTKSGSVNTLQQGSQF